MAYGLFYWGSQLKLDSLSSVVLYLGYLFLISLLDFLVTGKRHKKMGIYILTSLICRDDWFCCLLLGRPEALQRYTHRLMKRRGGC